MPIFLGYYYSHISFWMLGLNSFTPMIPQLNKHQKRFMMILVHVWAFVFTRKLNVSAVIRVKVLNGFVVAVINSFLGIINPFYIVRVAELIAKIQYAFSPPTLIYKK